MALAKITAKGQVPILLAIRQRLGIRPGDEIEFQETGNGILVTKCVAASPYRYVCRLPEKEAWSAARPYCRLTKLASRAKTQPSSVENNDVYSLVCPWRS